MAQEWSQWDPPKSFAILSFLISVILLESRMSSYTTESDTLIHLLRHLNNNRTDAVIGDPNISKNIQAALSDYSKYDVTILDINNLYLLQKADTDFLLQIIYESKDIDPDFKVFVSNNKIHKINFYKNNKLNKTRNTFFKLFSGL